jgi:hypothetical protein
VAEAVAGAAVLGAGPSPWLRSVLFDRGFLARMRGEAIKVYLVIVGACGGEPDRSVRMSLAQIMERTDLSCPTVIECLGRLEALGLVVSTTREPGRAKTYYVPDPPAASDSVSSRKKIRRDGGA